VVIEALQAAKDLKAKHKISAEVINVHTIKPLDSIKL
jgi:transketolase C-terminal domain/subunit